MMVVASTDNDASLSSLIGICLLFLLGLCLFFSQSHHLPDSESGRIYSVLGCIFFAYLVRNAG